MSINIPDYPAQTPAILQSGCPICLTQDISSQQIFKTPCNHVFCALCIQSWTKTNITCPVCRTQIKSPIMSPPYDSVYNRDLDIISSLASRKPEQARLLYQEYIRWLQGNRNSRPVIST
jgi:hypothetical protein